MKLDENQLEKFRKLADNGVFRSQNVGRASPVPFLYIRFATRKIANEYKMEIGGGKLKKMGAHFFLMVGPALLREYLPKIKEDLRQNYEAATIVMNWLTILEINGNGTEFEEIEKNRRMILFLKDKLSTTHREKKKAIVQPLNMDIGVLRYQLSLYEKTPENRRTLFQSVKINDLMKKLAELDPNGKEAEFLKLKEKCDFNE